MKALMVGSMITLGVLLAMPAAHAGAPRAGTYKLDDNLTLTLTPHKSGNFTVSGGLNVTIKGVKQHVTVEGTLYAKTNRLALNALDPRNGEWKPVNGHWDPELDTLVLPGWRGQQPLEPQDTLAIDFTGTWQTNWGPMTLHQRGNQVTGSYTHQGGHVSGTVSGSTLTLKWWQDGNGNSGEGTFTFVVENGRAKFKGTWRDKNGRGGGWSGTR